MTIDAKTSLLNLYQELASNKGLREDLSKVTSDSKAADRVAKQFFLKGETTEKGVAFHFSAKSFWDTLWGGIRKLWSREPPKEYNFDKNFAVIAKQFEQLSDPKSKEIIVQDPKEAENLEKLQAILNAMAKNVQGKGSHAKAISTISQKILASTDKPEVRKSEVKAPASTSFTQQAQALIKELNKLSEGQSEQLKEYLRPFHEKLSLLAEQQGVEIGSSHKNAISNAELAIGQIDLLKERFAVQSRQSHVQHLQMGVESAFEKISGVENTAKGIGLSKTLSETFPIVKLDQETRKMLETAENALQDPSQWEAVRADLDAALLSLEQLANRLEVWIDAQEALSGVSKARTFLAGDDNVEMRNALEQQLPKAAFDDRLESICKQLEGPLTQRLDLATISREKDEICSKVKGNRLITKAFEVETKSRLFKIADFRHKCEIVQGRISNLRLQVPPETKETFEKQARLVELEKALESHEERSQDPLFLNAEISEPWNQWETESQQLFSQADLVLSTASDALKKLTRRPEENELQTFENNAKRLIKSLASIPEKIASGMKIKHEINELHKALQEHIVDGKTSFDPAEKWLAWKAKAATLVEQAEAVSQKTQGWIALMERSRKSRKEYETATAKLLENCYIPGRPPLLGNDSVQQLFELFSDPQYKQEEIQQLQTAFLKNVKDYEAALVSSYKEDPAAQSLKEKDMQATLAERRNALETEEREEFVQHEATSQMCKLYQIEFSDLQQKGFDLLRVEMPKTLEELKELANPEKFRQRQAERDEKFVSLLQQVQKRREQVASEVDKLHKTAQAFVDQFLNQTLQKLQQTAKEFSKADKAWPAKVTDDMLNYCRAQKAELLERPKPPTSPELYERWQKEIQAKQQAQIAQLTTLCQKLLASKDSADLLKVCEESVLVSKSKTIQQTISDIRKTYAKSLSDFPFAKEAINKIESEAKDLMRSEKGPQELVRSAEKMQSSLSMVVSQLLSMKSEIKERSLDKDKVVATIRMLAKKVERLGDIEEKVNRNLEFARASLQEKFPKLFEIPEETGESDEDESVEEVSFDDFDAMETWLTDALEVQENAPSFELYQESMKTNRQLCDYIRAHLAPTFENSLVQYLEIQGVMHKLQKVTAEMSGQKERMTQNQKAMLDVCQLLLNRQANLLTVKESKTLDDLEAALTQIPPKDIQAHSLVLDKIGQWLKDPNKYVTDEQIFALTSLLKGATVTVDLPLLSKVGAFLATDEGASVAGILQTARADEKQVLQKKKAVSLKAIEDSLLESLPLQERVSAVRGAIAQKKAEMTPVQVKLCDLLDKHVAKIAQALQRRVDVPQPDRELDSYRTILTSLTKWLSKPNEMVTDEQIQSLVALVERYEESIDLVLLQLMTTYLTSDQGAFAQVRVGRADRDVQIRQLLTTKKADTLAKIEAEAIKKAPKDVKLKSQETWNQQLAKKWIDVDAISTDLFGEHEAFTKLIDELKPKIERFYADKGVWSPKRFEEIEKAIMQLEIASSAHDDLKKYLEPIQALKEVLSKAKEAL